MSHNLDDKTTRTADLNKIFIYPEFSEWNELTMDIVRSEVKHVRLSRVNGEFMEILLDDFTWEEINTLYEVAYFKHKYGDKYDYLISGTSYQPLFDIPDNCKLHIKVVLPKDRQTTIKTKNMYQQVTVGCSLDVFHLVNSFALKNSKTTANKAYT